MGFAWEIHNTLKWENMKEQDKSEDINVDKQITL
jgi:hypothetical protein